MKDRELLEAAALAVGIDGEYMNCDEGLWLKGKYTPDNSAMWNPLRVDGDCARLESVCQIELNWSGDYGVAARLQRSAHASEYAPWCGEPYARHPDRNAARRRASVRAAASLSKVTQPVGVDRVEVK